MDNLQWALFPEMQLLKYELANMMEHVLKQIMYTLHITETIPTKLYMHVVQERVRLHFNSQLHNFYLFRLPLARL
jgi:hypothetical protein